MAETLTAQLALELGGFTAGLQSASQAFQQFSRDLANQVRNLVQPFAQLKTTVEDNARARVRIEKQVVDEITSLQRNFFNVTTGLAKDQVATTQRLNKERADQERRELNATQDLYRNFYHNLTGMAKDAEERIATERRLRNNQLRAELNNLSGLSRSPSSIAGGTQSLPVNNLSFGPGGIAELQGYINLLNQATPAQNTLTNAVAFFGETLTKAGIILGLSQIVRLFTDFVQSSTNAAIQFQTLQAVFRGTSGGARQGAEALAFLREESTRLGVNFETLANSYKNFNASSNALNISTKDSREIFLAFANAARALGLSSDQLQHILVAVEQIMSKGKVSAEELRRQLGNSLPGAFAIAARSIGVTTSELDSMLKKGDLVSSDFILPFAREVQRTFGDLVPEQTKTAQAAFERFYNEVKILQIAFGDSIVAAFQPAFEFINKVLEGYRKEREERAKLTPNQLQPLQDETSGDINRKLKEVADRINIINQTIAKLEEQKTNQLFDVARLSELLPDRIGTRIDLTSLKNAIKQQGLDATISQLADEAASLGKTYELLIEKQKQLQQTLGDDGGASGAVLIPFKKQAEAINRELEELENKLQSLSKEVALFDISAITRTKDEFGDVNQAIKDIESQLTQSRERYKEIEQASQKIAETISGSKGLQKAITPEIQTQVDKVRALLSVEGLRIKLLEDELELHKETAKELEKGDKQRRDNIADRVKEEEKSTQQEIDNAEHAFDVINNLKRKFADEQVKIEREITLLTAKETRTRSDDLRAKLEEDIKAYRLRGAEPEQIARLTQAALNQIHRVETEDLDRELKRQQVLIREQEKPWRELGTKIEGILSGVFERILTGSQSIFDGIKDAFIKLLARLAAEAAAAQIVIGIRGIAGQIFGSGTGAAGGATNQGIGTTLLGTVFGGGSQGSGNAGGSGVGGIVSDVGQQVGGKLITQGVKSAFGEYLSQIGSTTLFTSTTPGATAGEGVLFGSSASGGVATETTAFTLGQLTSILGGALTGVAVGFIVKNILDESGATQKIGSRGSGAIAGGVGGAVGGAIIGAEIASVGGPAGAVIGAALGALIGAIAAGPTRKTPFIDIKTVERGYVTYDDVLGLTASKFKITDAPFRNIGKKVGGETYETFIQQVDTSINETFGQVIEAFRTLQPEVQKALVGPLNDVAEAIRIDIEKTKFKGSYVFDDLERYFSQDLPAFINKQLAPIQEALKKIDPYVRAFNEAINAAQQRIDEITQLQAQSTISVQTQLANLRKANLSPFEILSDRLGILNQSRAGLGSLEPLQALGAGKLIQGLVDEIAQLTATLREQVTQTSTSVGSQLTALQESTLSPDALVTKRLGQLAAAQGALATASPTQLLALAPIIQELVQEIGSLDTSVTATTEDFAALRKSLQDQVTQIQDSQLTTFDLLVAKQQQLVVSLEALDTATEGTRATLVTESQGLAQNLQSITTQLAQQRDQLAASLTQQIHALEEGLFTPAQVYVRRQGELAQLQTEFSGASPSRRVALIPQIQALAQDLFSLGRSNEVLGQDPQLVRQTQSELLDLLQGLQDETTDLFQSVDEGQALVLEALGQLQEVIRETGTNQVDAQASFQAVLEEALQALQERLLSTSETLATIPGALIETLNEVQSANDAAYSHFIDLLQEQITLSQEQISLLIGSLNDLNSIDAVVKIAAGVLGHVNANILATREQESIQNQLQIELLAGSYVSLQGIQDSSGRQVGLLGSISQSLQAGSFGGVSLNPSSEPDDSGEGFARGSNYIPYNMVAFLHQGEAVIPRHLNRGGGQDITINVNGSVGSDGADLIAERVASYIEKRSGRLQAGRISVRKN